MLRRNCRRIDSYIKTREDITDSYINKEHKKFTLETSFLSHNVSVTDYKYAMEVAGKYCVNIYYSNVLMEDCGLCTNALSADWHEI